MSKSFDIHPSELVRVVVDALAGCGIILRQGEVVDRGVLGDYYDSLIAQGAVVPCESRSALVPNA